MGYKINLPALLEAKREEEGRDKGIPLTEVAMESGISYLTILNIFHDGSSWRRQTLEKLCQYLGKEPGEILEKVED